MNPEKLSLDAPVSYTVRIIGVLDEKWSDYYGRLTVSVSPTDDDDRPTTTLSGRLADQAALLGLLNALYDYRYPLLFVECCCDEPQ